MKMFLLSAVLLSGCAAPAIHIQYASDPPGATLYQNGQVMGTLPNTLNYPVSEAFKTGGCQFVAGTSAKWVSGAESQIPGWTVCASQGNVLYRSFIRPDVPGREIDANFALQLQRNRIMGQQAQAARDAAGAAAMQNYLNMMRGPDVPLPSNSLMQERRCTSQWVGQTVQTICY